MKYLVEYCRAEHPRIPEYFVVDGADDAAHAAEQLLDAEPCAIALKVYKLRAVPVKEWDYVLEPEQGRACQQCGYPDRWPLCYHCERADCPSTRALRRR